MAMLAGMVIDQAAEFRAQRVMLTCLASEIGIDPEKFTAVLNEKAAKLSEEVLLMVGDKSPEIAELLDISGRLRARRDAPDQ